MSIIYLIIIIDVKYLTECVLTAASGTLMHCSSRSSTLPGMHMTPSFLQVSPSTAPPPPRVLPVSPAYWPSDQLLLLYPHNRQFWHPAMTQYLPPWDQTDIPMKAPCAQNSGCLDIFTCICKAGLGVGKTAIWAWQQLQA